MRSGNAFLNLSEKHENFSVAQKIFAFLDFQALESLLKKLIITIPLKSDVIWV